MSVDRDGKIRPPWPSRRSPAVICDGVLRVLIGRCALGDTEAFTAVYACLLPDVVGVLQDLDAGAGDKGRIDRNMAAVVTTGVFLELWQRAAMYTRTGGPSIRSWSREVTCRHVAEYRRRGRPTAAMISSDARSEVRLNHLLAGGVDRRRAEPSAGHRQALRKRKLWKWVSSSIRGGL